MRRRNKSGDRGWLFITGTTHRRLPLFRVREHCEIFVENLLFYRRKYELEVGAYVLLPDHYHLLLRIPPEIDVRDVLRDFKSAVGRQVIDRLKKGRKDRLLARLAVSRRPRRRKDARYKTLQADNHIKKVVSEKFFKQKLDYIHTNPVQEGLAERTIDYPYSSARWYADGGQEERAQWQGPLG